MPYPALMLEYPVARRLPGLLLRLTLAAWVAGACLGCSDSNPTVLIRESDAAVTPDAGDGLNVELPDAGASGADAAGGAAAVRDAAAADIVDADASVADTSLRDAATGDFPADAAADLPDSGDALVQFVVFRDPSTDFETSEVRDVDREVVRFHAQDETMLWADGTPVSGWSTDGNDLDWTRSGVAFQVRFGTEAGERRAYFTETATGTICNLNITGADQLTIFGTSELPPQE